jgi:S1-C subfamily serine protease
MKPSSSSLIQKTLPLVAVTIATATLLTSSNNKPMNIYARASPSVVSVKSMELERDVFSYSTFKPIETGIGAGFFIDKTNHIVTNAHVVTNATDVVIKYSDGKEEYASVVGYDNKRDVAILELSSTSSTQPPLPLSFCTTDAQVGQAVATIGSPFGLEHSLSVGIISGIHRIVDGPIPLVNMIQTDAAINPGNSGGPLINLSNGCVIGMNTAMIAPGVGFAIPSEDITDSVSFILKDHRRPDALGFVLMPDPIIKDLGLPGISVVSVMRNTIADTMGFIGASRDAYGRPVLGDIILQVNGRFMRSNADFQDILNADTPILNMLVLRGNSEVSVIIDRNK